MNNHILKQSLWCAVGVFAYIVVIVNVMTGLLPRFEVENTVFAPIMFLTLFVISAAVTGGLVLGKPIMLYLGGHTKEGIMMFFSTLGFLVFFLFLTLAVLLGTR